MLLVLGHTTFCCGCFVILESFEWFEAAARQPLNQALQSLDSSMLPRNFSVQMLGCVEEDRQGEVKAVCRVQAKKPVAATVDVERLFALGQLTGKKVRTAWFARENVDGGKANSVRKFDYSRGLCKEETKGNCGHMSFIEHVLYLCKFLMFFV